MIEQWITQLSSFLKMDWVIWIDTLSDISWRRWLKCWNVVKVLALHARSADKIFHLCLRSVSWPRSEALALCVCVLFLSWTSPVGVAIFIFKEWRPSLLGTLFNARTDCLSDILSAAPREPVRSPRQRQHRLRGLDPLYSHSESSAGLCAYESVSVNVFIGDFWFMRIRVSSGEVGQMCIVTI